MNDKTGGNPNKTTEEKSIAYFKAVVRNSKKMEYRQNTNAAKHISPTGIWFDGYQSPLAGDDETEHQISIQSADDWLLFIENEHLHKALLSLKPEDLEFLFVFYKNGYTERQMAEYLGVQQNAVHKRRKRILKKIKIFYEKVVKNRG